MTVLNKQDIQVILGGSNVQTLITKLTSLKQSLRSLTIGEVDHEVSEESDLVRFIFKNYPTGQEWLQLWMDIEEKKWNAVQALVIDVIRLLVQSCKIMEIDSILHSGQVMCKSIIRLHIKYIYRHLSSGTVQLMQNAIGLLEAIANYSSSVNIELHKTFNFGMKSLAKLLKMRKKRPSPSQQQKQSNNESGDSSAVTKPQFQPVDIRSLYIRFILSFLILGDTSVKTVVLDIKDFVSGFLKGMNDDPFYLIKLILDTFKEHVIVDMHLSRTSKVGFFNSYVLEHILKLYSLTQPENENNESIADLAHSFLMYICTTPGVGVCFHDQGWYPPSYSGATTNMTTISSVGNEVNLDNQHIKSNTNIKVYNKILSRFILALKPTDSTRQQELLLSIFKACPELISYYWSQTTTNTISLEPRNSDKWLANMHFVLQVVQLPVPEYLGSQSRFSLSQGKQQVFTIPPPQNILDNILPPLFSRVLLSKGLQNEDENVKLVVALFLISVFDKFKTVQTEWERTFEHVLEMTSTLSSNKQGITSDISILDKSLSKKDSSLIQNKWQDAWFHIYYELRRALPDVQTVIGLQQFKGTNHTSALLKEEYDNGKMQIVQDDTNDGNINPHDHNEKEKDSALDDIKNPNKNSDHNDDLQWAALSLLHHFQIYFPDLIQESRYDFGKLLPIQNATKRVQDKLIDVLTLSCHSLKWWNKNDKQGLSHMGRLLESFCVSATVDPIQKDDVDMKSVDGEDDRNEFTLKLRGLIVFCLTSSPLFNEQTTFNVYLLLDNLCLFYRDDHASLNLILTWLDSILNTGIKQHGKYEKNISDLTSDEHPEAQTPITIFSVLLMEYLSKTSQNTPVLHLFAFSFLIQEFLFGYNNVNVFQKCIKWMKDTCNESKSILNHSKITFFYNWSLGFTSDQNNFVSLTENLFVTWLHDVSAAIENIKKRMELLNSFLLDVHHVSSSTKITLMNHSLAFDSLNWYICLTQTCLHALSVNDITSDFVFRNLNTILDIINEKGHNKTEISSLYALILNSKKIQELFKIYWNGDSLDTESETSYEFGNFVIKVLQLSSKLEFEGGNHGVVLDSYQSSLVDTICNSLSSSLKSNSKLYSNFVTFLSLEHLSLILKYIQTQKLSLSAPEHFEILYQIQNSLQTDLLNDQHPEYSLFLDILKEHVDWERIISTLSPNESFMQLMLFALTHISDLSVRTKNHHTNKRKLSENATMYDDRRTKLSIIDSEWVLKHVDVNNDTWKKLVLTICNINDSFCDTLLTYLHDNITGKQQDEALSGEMAWLLSLYLTNVSIIIESENQEFDGVKSNSRNNYYLQWNESKLGSSKKTILLNVLQVVSKSCQHLIKSILNGSSSKVELDSIKNILTCMMLETSLRSKILNDLACVLKLLIDNKKAKIKNVQGAYSIYQALQNNTISEDELHLPAIKLYILILRDTLHQRKRFDLDEPLQELDQLLFKLYKENNHHLWSRIIMDRNHLEDLLQPVLVHCLKYRLGDRLSIDFLTQNLDAFFISFQPEELMDMLLGHSQFDKIMYEKLYDERTKLKLSHRAKASILKLSHKLLLSCHKNDPHYLVIKQPELCLTLTKMYGGTCSASDLEIMRILRFFEIHTGVSVANIVMNNFGKSEQHQIEAKSTTAADQFLTVLERFSQEMMGFTIQNFTMNPHKNEEDENNILITYDPWFVLQASLHHLYATAGEETLTGAESLDRMKAMHSQPILFLDKNVLGLAIVCLSSEDLFLRKTAYLVLDQVYPLLNNEDMVRYREKRQVMLVLDNLKNLIEERNEDLCPRLPTSIALFFAQSLRTMLTPESNMYPLINRFFLSRPIMDIEDVPMFYELFYSVSDDARKERLWMLRLLSHGLKSAHDYQIYQRRHVSEQLMSLFQSPLVDVTSRKWILHYFHQSCNVKDAILDLIVHRGFLSFIQSCILSIQDLVLLQKCVQMLLKVLSSWRDLMSTLSNDKIHVWETMFIQLCDTLIIKLCGLNTDYGDAASTLDMNASTNLVTSSIKFIFECVSDVHVNRNEGILINTLRLDALAGLIGLIPLSVNNSELPLSSLVFEIICLSGDAEDNIVLDYTLKQLESMDNVDGVAHDKLRWLTWVKSTNSKYNENKKIMNMIRSLSKHRHFKVSYIAKEMMLINDELENSFKLEQNKKLKC